MKAKTKCNRGYEPGYPKITPLGDAAVIVQLGSRIDDAINHRVLAIERSLWAAGISGVTASVPAYASLTVHFDPLKINFQTMKEVLLQRLTNPLEEMTLVGSTIEIPVIYGGELGADLESVARHCRLTVDEVIRRHAAPEYRVHFIGFLPGFPYLGGMDADLATPRLASPRTLVRAGSVGIAGGQTGIYPLDSPGGWRIIGWTPTKLFNSFDDPPALLAPGDRVRFVPVSPGELPDA